MSHDDLVKIRVNQQHVGIMGLKKVLEAHGHRYAQKPDEEVEAELVKRLSKANYIPDSAKEAYGKALLREFNKYLGRPYEEELQKVLTSRCWGLDVPDATSWKWTSWKWRRRWIFPRRWIT